MTDQGRGPEWPCNKQGCSLAGIVTVLFALRQFLYERLGNWGPHGQHCCWLSFGPCSGQGKHGGGRAALKTPHRLCLNAETEAVLSGMG